MSKHCADRAFAKHRITAHDTMVTSVTGPTPWRRYTRDKVTLVFHMVMTRPPGDYEGQHRRPRPNEMPDDMVYWSDPAERWMVARENYKDEPLDNAATLT